MDALNKEELAEQIYALHYRYIELSQEFDVNRREHIVEMAQLHKKIVDKSLSLARLVLDKK